MAKKTTQIITILLILSSLSFSQTKKKIFYNGDKYSSSLTEAQSLASRGFNTAFRKYITSSNDFKNLQDAGMNAVAILVHDVWGYSLLRYDPFDEESSYDDNKTKLKSKITNVKDRIDGIFEDFEIPVFNTIEYKLDGTEDSDKKFIYGTKRIGDGASSGAFTEGFTEYQNYSISNLTHDKIKYNFPNTNGGVEQTNINAGLLLGYSTDYFNVAQTFKPVSNKISKIDIKIKRNSTNDFPGRVMYYLTEVNSLGYPLTSGTNSSTGEPNVITSKREIRAVEFSYNGTNPNDFNGIVETSLYFDPNEMDLDINKQYALVLRYNSQDYSNYYRVAAQKSSSIDAYPYGCYIKGNIYDNAWTKYDNQDASHIYHDLNFKVYYPDIPTQGTQVNVAQLDNSQHALILGYNSSYKYVSQSFVLTQSTNLCDIDLSIYKMGSGSISDIDVEIYPKTSTFPNLSSSPVAQFRISKESLNQGINSIKAELPKYLSSGEYFLILSYTADSYSTSNYYYVRGKESGLSGPYTYGTLMKGNGSIWTEYPTKDLYFRLNSSTIGLNYFHNAWIDFQTGNMAKLAKEYDDLLNNIDPDLKLYIYSGYTDYIYEGETSEVRYSIDWSEVGKYADYPICGYGPQSTTATQNILSSLPTSRSLIGGVQNQNNATATFNAFDERFTACDGGAMYWYDKSKESEHAINVFSLAKKRSSNNAHDVPSEFKLEQNYPNPFNPDTKISFSIPSNELVTLEIFNILGQKVKTLVSGNLEAGIYYVHFNASNLSSGIYIYKIIAGKFTNTKKMILTK